MQLRRATQQDIPLLVQLRLNFLRLVDHITDEEAEAVAASLPAYLEQALADNTFWAVLCEEDGEVAASIFAAVTQRIPKANNLDGRTLYITNVFTSPQHRGKGYASAVVQHMLNTAREHGITAIYLQATAAGRPVYEKLGFTQNKMPTMDFIWPA